MKITTARLCLWGAVSACLALGVWNTAAQIVSPQTDIKIPTQIHSVALVALILCGVAGISFLSSIQRTEVISARIDAVSAGIEDQIRHLTEVVAANGRPGDREAADGAHALLSSLGLVLREMHRVAAVSRGAVEDPGTVLLPSGQTPEEYMSAVAEAFGQLEELYNWDNRSQ